MTDDIQQDESQQNNNNNIDELQQELNNTMAAWKRTAADFENYKKRSEAEKKELLEFAKEVAVVKLLPTLDTLSQALKHLPQLGDKQISESVDKFEKQYENWQVGAKGIVIQLDKVLEEMGVKKIEAMGKKFDPNFHEAVKEVESEADDGIVIDELQSGFELNGKVIRPSQVTISKRKI
jgi:molecular chaperone GrpE